MESVKNILVQDEPTGSATGRGEFHFTDDYSVFDWGKMPDEIEGKGQSLCMMGAYNFERLEEAGVSTHYRGVVEDGEVKATEEVDQPSRVMAIEMSRVPPLPYDDGAYDYESFHREAGENYVIPLEIVFRNAVPEGSSLRRRRSPRDVGLDVSDWPEQSIDLDEPLVEFSTKYEQQDRYIPKSEARDISGLGDQFDQLIDVARDVNRVVTERAEQVGLSHEDGKIECMYVNGAIKVADVVGTFDENRFLMGGQQISKEFLRQFYKSYDPGWVQAVKEAKQVANQQGVADWRPLTDETPDPLPENVRKAASNLYRAGTNLYTGQDWFEVSPLDEVLDTIRRLREERF